MLHGGATLLSSDTVPFRGTPYRWVRLVGSGGMGEVHFVRHEVLGTEFAAKVLHQRYASNEQLADRVRVEAQSLGRLEHPNIVRVSSFGRLEDGRPFFIMEALSGHTLETEIRSRDRLPVAEALRYSLELASALGAAHALGVIHRDIKPENLFLHHGHDGARILKVLDFGVARVVPGISDASPVPLLLPTETGIVVGTPRYVSPEAAQGQRVDHRADIYGAGLVLYSMLTGNGPFDHLKNEQSMLMAHVQTAPPSLASRGLRVSAEVEALVQRMLAKNPAHRFASAAELERHLAAALQQQSAIVEKPTMVSPLAPPSSPPVAPTYGFGHTLPIVAPAPKPSAGAPQAEEPPVSAIVVREGRGPAFIATLFCILVVLIGLASAGAVVIVRRFVGGP